MPRIKTATVSLRMKPEIKALGEKAAEADHRSFTAYIEKLILDDAGRKAIKRPDNA